MKLYPITVKKMHLLEAGQFIIRTTTDITNLGLTLAQDADIAQLHASLMSQSPTFELAIMQVRSQAETSELAALDSIRDKKFTTLKRAFSVFENTDDSTEKTAYNLVKLLLNNYKDIDVLNYEAESLAIDRLILDLNNATYATAVQTLSLQNHISNLETANNNFKTKFSARSSNTINTVVYDSKLLRKNIFETYKELADFAVVMAKRRPADAYYSSVLTAINAGREYFANIIARREGATSTT
jgi:Family of unknown function (DUF6261)